MHIQKIKHSMLCVTGVYLRDITYIIFVILHLNSSCLNVCSSLIMLAVDDSWLFVYCLFSQIPLTCTKFWSERMFTRNAVLIEIVQVDMGAPFRTGLYA